MIDQFYVTIAVCALFLYLLLSNGNKRLPPGPIKFPILGSLIQLYRANPQYPHIAMSKLAAIYGDIMSFGFGMQTSVVVSSYEAMREVFKLHDTNASRFLYTFVEDRNYGKNLGIIFGHGQNWADIRAFTKKTLKEFGYGKATLMDQSLADSGNQLVDDIKTELLDSTDETFAVETGKFAVHVLNVVWNLVGGYKFDSNDKLLKNNMKCVDKLIKILGNENLYNVFPFLKKWFPNQVQYPEHLKIHAEIHDFSKYLINDAKEKRSQRFDAEPTSFIEVFLDKIDECHEDPNTLFTQEQLEIILEDLLLGSLETAATLLNWAILFMALHPNTQNKARQEILDRMGSLGGDVPTIELKRLPYLKATILEVLRKGDIVPMPSPRCTTKDVTIRNYIIPKGTILFYNLHTIYNDTTYWTDPENFRPERFLTESGQVDQSRSERILNTVFGVGPRMCFGENVAIDALFTFFAALIINFKIEAIPGREPSDANPNFGMTIAPRKYCVKMTKK